MKAIDFKEQNVVEDKDHGILPAYISTDRTSIMCFKLNKEEAERVANGESIWVKINSNKDSGTPMLELTLDKPVMEKIYIPPYRPETIVYNYKNVYKCVLIDGDKVMFVRLKKSEKEGQIFELDLKDIKIGDQKDEGVFSCEIIETQEKFEKVWNRLYDKGHANYIEFKKRESEPTPKMKVVE